jgi:hypothetical protein
MTQPSRNTRNARMGLALASIALAFFAGIILKYLLLK